jgi:hypothetical protein
MTIDALKEKLRSQEVGFENNWVYPDRIPPAQVDEILYALGNSEEIGRDWNGCDLDWSQEVNFEGMKFSVWGSAYMGSLVFKKRDEI